MPVIGADMVADPDAGMVADTIAPRIELADVIGGCQVDFGKPGSTTPSGATFTMPFSQIDAHTYPLVSIPRP